MFQPPNARDLASFPPADDRCRRVRAMLRDHADGDLPRALSTEVERHVHRCRACALALARAELEVVRLRRALEPERGELEPPPSFTASTMARVAAAAFEDAAFPAGEEPAPARPAARAGVSSGFTGRVMDRVRKEWRPSVWQRIALGARSPWAWLPATAALLLVAAWLARSVDSMDAPVVVREALAADLIAGDAVRPLRRGEPVPRGAQVATRAGGRSVLGVGRRAFGLDRELPGDGDVTLEPDSRVVHEEFGLRLRAGGVEVDAGRPLLVAVEGGGLVRLAAGEYHLSVAPVQRFDRALFPFGGDHRVTLEVARGRAELFRGGAAERLLLRGERGRYEGGRGAVVVDAGLVATFDSRSAVELAPRLDPSALTAISSPLPGGDRAAAAATGGVVRHRGRVLSAATGLGVGGVPVRVVTPAGEYTPVTGPGGEFDFDAPEDAGHVIVASAGSEAGRFGPAPLGRRRVGGEIALDDLYLDPGLALAGRVVSEGRGVAGARVSAVVVDELFACVEELDGARATTDETGRFELRRVRSRLEPHQRLALLVEHDELPLAAYLGTGAAFDWRAPGSLYVDVVPGRRFVVAGLPPDATATLCEGVPGVPGGAMVVTRSLRADALGIAEASVVGPGPWFAVVGGGEVFALVEERGRLVARGRAALADLPLAAALRRPGRPLGTGALCRVVTGSRYRAAERDVAAGATMVVRVDDGVGQAMPGARLFVRSASGTLSYVGEHDERGVLAVSEPRQRPFDLIAVDPSGYVGVLRVGDAERVPGEFGIHLLAPGRALLARDEPAAPVAGVTLVRLEMTEGLLPGAVFWRAIGALDTGGWTLPDLLPGTYRVAVAAGDELEVVVRPGGSARVSRPR